ncbi:vps-39, partial [Pristionchus pacificus]|uniref:Vps-39 n=1 Tax=Pristionchus pacificus TaxID=54126 RepID=A0A2A6CGA7_PRIPA
RSSQAYHCAMYEAYVSSEVAFKLPVEINAITFHTSAKRIFALSKCDLHFYTPAKSGRRGYELENVAKRISRKPVQQLKVVDDADFLLTLSDQVLSLHSLTFPFPVKAIVRVKGVTAFTAHVDKKNKDFYITVASKRKFTILKWKDDDFVEQIAFKRDGKLSEVLVPNLCKEWLITIYSIVFFQLSNCDLPIPTDNPLIITWSRRCLCYAIRDSYNLIGMTYNSETQAWSGENTKLFPVGDVPCILDISERKLVGFTRGDMVTLRSSSVGEKLHGTSPTLSQDVKFTGTLLAVVNDGPYLVGLLPKGIVEIRSISPSYLIQTITLGKAVMLAPALSGQVCVASAFDVWLLDSHSNLRKNVNHLVNERHFDLAVQLADCGKLFNESEKVEIKSQSALNLFNQRKFEDAFKLHAEIKTNVISVLSLFPDLLPEKFTAHHSPNARDLAENEKKRAMLALSVYLAEARTQLAFSLEQHNKAKNGEKNGILLSKEDHDRAKTELQIVDTTLLQCYLKIRPMLVDSLLRLNNNSCSFEDAETMLRDAKQLRSLFILYETRRKHTMALSLLKEQAALAPNSDPFFHGIEPTVEYLQTLGNSHLDSIFEYAKWVLAVNPKDGLSIFTGDETSDLARNLDRDRVLDFLEEECIQAVIPYLEHVIYRWEDESPRLHEALLEYYARKVKELLKEYTHAFHDDENVIRAGDEEGDLGAYRRAMLKFLHKSLSYSPNKILVQLNHYAFCEERALILGRLKKHEEALSIYTGVLHDIKAAEEYCRLYYNASDPIDSQVYLHLVRAFVSPSDPQLGTAVLVSPDADLPVPTPNIPQAIKVLSQHADKMDAVAALSLIPNVSSLCDLSASLTALVRATAQEAAATSIRRALCESACLRVEQRLKEVSATRVLITSNTQCVHCEKKIGTRLTIDAFVRYAQTGELEHLYCHEKSDRNKIQV